MSVSVLEDKWTAEEFSAEFEKIFDRRIAAVKMTALNQFVQVRFFETIFCSCGTGDCQPGKLLTESFLNEPASYGNLAQRVYNLYRLQLTVVYLFS